MKRWYKIAHAYPGTTNKVFHLLLAYHRYKLIDIKPASQLSGSQKQVPALTRELSTSSWSNLKNC